MKIVEVGNKKSRLVALTLLEIVDMNNRGLLDFDVEINGVNIQRAKVEYGENSTKKFNAKKLMLDTLEGIVEIYDFGIIKVIELNGKLGVYDGKQKVTTFISFINNEFPLKKVSKEYESTEISNMYFKDLPEILRKRIENTEILIGLYREEDKNRIPQLFLNTNSTGVALNQFDTDRIQLFENGKYLETAKDIPYFKNVLFNNKKKDYGFKPQNHLFELAIIKNSGGTKCLTNKNARGSIIVDIKNEKINFKRLVESTCDVLAYMEDAMVNSDGFEMYKHNLSSFIHTKTLFSCAIIAIEHDIPKKEFGKWITFDMMMGNMVNNQNEYWAQVKDATTNNAPFYILQSMFNKSFFEKYNTVDSENLAKWKQKKEKDLLKQSK